MNMYTFLTAAEIAVNVAEDIAGYVRKNPGALLCMAAGDVALPVFRALIVMQSRGEVDLNSVFYVGLCEWVGVSKTTAGSFSSMFYEDFIGPAGVDIERVCLWDGSCDRLESEKRRVERWLSERGGLGLAVLDIGRNGRVGFNEPNTGFAEGAVIVALDYMTITEAMRYFKGMLPVRYGVSLGLGELNKADKLILVAIGDDKTGAVSRAVNGGRSFAAPVSLLMDHGDVTLYTDGGGAA